MTDVEQGKQVLEQFNKEVMEWLDKHKISKLPAYESLRDKETFGNSYRTDQHYYEQVANFRAQYFALKGYFSKIKSQLPPRASGSLDDVLSYISDQLKMVDTYTEIARQRIKFYDSLAYVISNMSFGDY